MFNKKTQENPQEDSFQMPKIHVMPPVFLSAAVQKVKLKKKKKVKKQKMEQPQKQPSQPAKKRLIHPLVVVFGAILIVGLGGVVVYLLTYKAEQDPIVATNINIPVNTNTNKNTNQSNINQEPQPPKLICGDGILSEENEEECDDGNTISKDGCSAQCKIETLPSFSNQITPFTSYPATTDSDEDFLTDVEEQLYSTGINNMDEDGDKYLDGLELINLYNPKNKTPSELVDSDIVNIFNNQEQGYSLFYPEGWQVRYLNDDKSEVYFESHTVEFVQVLVTENPNKDSIITWAKNQFSDIDISKLERVGVGDKLGIKSPNGLTVNFSNEDKIYSVTYQTSTLRKLNFKATFQMMYNSLKLYSRAGGVTPPPSQWSSYINNQLGVKLQHPINLEVTVGENNSIKMDDFRLQFINNTQGAEFDNWFWENHSKEANYDCQLKNSELKIGKLRTFFVDKIAENGEVNADKRCEDGGYYSISSDKKQIIKLTIGSNPVREMAQILATIQLFEAESSVENSN
jgi:cysteine-rich repeat protein